MLVNEIFRSIQGESSYSGLPCVFIRLTGCNLRCSYCDTKYAYKEGKNMLISRIVSEVKKLYKEGDIIEITGGEPLTHKNIQKLISKIHGGLYKGLGDMGVNILVETNGSILLPKYTLCTWIMDWKLPSSGMNDKMEYVNLERLDEDDELKFVIETEEDYEEMKRILDKYDIDANIIISTVWEGKQQKDIAEQMLKDNIQARFQIQLHKIIWDKDKRAV